MISKNYSPHYQTWSTTKHNKYFHRGTCKPKYKYGSPTARRLQYTVTTKKATVGTSNALKTSPPHPPHLRL